ncbi:response regulator [Sphingomonas jaspsi]|uniref:response regulator n=1 Tax=Sphingomonas jaspsi TaxID=392409 RepID=UPI0004AE50BC|nr:response regulator [Sphingomonas jaspsi]
MLFGKRTRNVKRILIVEDEPLTAFDNEQMLSAAGYEVVGTVDRVAEAVPLLDHEDGVDLILSDVRLTGQRTGIDLARIAKERGIPLLFVTGREPEGAEALALGVLLKPYSHKQLRTALDAIDRHLGGELPKPPKGLTLYVPTTA